MARGTEQAAVFGGVGTTIRGRVLMMYLQRFHGEVLIVMDVARGHYRISISPDFTSASKLLCSSVIGSVSFGAISTVAKIPSV